MQMTNLDYIKLAKLKINPVCNCN